MWQALLTGLALMLVIEGILPFLAPDLFKRMIQSVVSAENSTLRIHGLVTMLSGVGLLYFIR